jgi:hypothetical protein
MRVAPNTCDLAVHPLPICAVVDAEKTLIAPVSGRGLGPFSTTTNDHKPFNNNELTLIEQESS